VDRHSLAENAGQVIGKCQTRTGFLKSTSRNSALLVLAVVLVLAVGLICGVVEEGRTFQGWLTIWEAPLIELGTL
jgi:hypothetical protein